MSSHAGNERLPALLASMLDQTVRAGSFRVLVVDNASPQPLAAVLEPFYRSLDLRCVVEARLGLSNARNRALGATDTEIIVFLDDDVTLSRSFVAAYVEAFSDESVVAAGGPIRAAFPRRPPLWLRGPVESLYSIQDLGAASVYGGSYSFGANMAFRMDAVTQRFSALLGRVGPSLLSGEECLFMRRNGFDRIIHVPDAAVEHHISVDRMRVTWLLRRAAAQVRTRHLTRWATG